MSAALPITDLDEQLPVIDLEDSLPIMPSEYRAFERLPAWTVSELAEKGERRLTTGPHEGQPWKNATAPYLVKPMDDYQLPWVREVTIEAGNQVGKTEVIYNCYCHDVRYWPTHGMIVMQNEDTAEKIMRDRLLPMVKPGPKQTQFLADLFTGFKQDQGIRRLAFANGATLYPAWYTSDNTTETFSIERLYLDEPDFAPPGTSMERIHKRTTVFPHTYKILTTCKPLTENGPTHTAFQAADVRYFPHLVCLECDEAFPATWKHVKWPKDVDENTIRRRRLAYLECPHCKAQLTDQHRDQAVALAHEQGRLWKPDKKIDRPAAIAFRIPTMLSRFVSLSVLAREFIRATRAKKHGDQEPLKTFITTRLGEPWIPQKIDRDEEVILALRDERPAGVIPPGVVALTAGVDTQDDGFWYGIRAWGNPEPRCLSSWLIQYGFLATWDDLEALLFEGEWFADGEEAPYKLERIFQDAKGHRTSEVYRFAEGHRGIYYPSMGFKTQSKPWYPTKVEQAPDGRPIPGGVQRINVHATYYKDLLDGKLKVQPGQAGEFRLHRDTSYDYASQMLAEYRDEDGFWQQTGRPNHLWDVEVLNLCAADHLHVASRSRRRRPPAKKQAAKTNQSTRNPNRKRRPKLW